MFVVGMRMLVRPVGDMSDHVVDDLIEALCDTLDERQVDPAVDITQFDEALKVSIQVHLDAANEADAFFRGSELIRLAVDGAGIDLDSVSDLSSSVRAPEPV